ncbi:MAG: hypothetical protein JST84_04730 [Acidobacteria bacterium]|nr:hypothetical protein [Acidobacteriota bacterium]
MEKGEAEREPVQDTAQITPIVERINSRSDAYIFQNKKTKEQLRITLTRYADGPRITLPVSTITLSLAREVSQLINYILNLHEPNQ